MAINGGWRRLWVVIAALYFVAVAAIAWSTSPTPESIHHNAALYSAVPPTLRSRILNSKVRPESEADFIREAANAKDAVLAEMPNGHTLVFRSSLDRSDMDASAKAYWISVQQAAAKERQSHILRAVAWWALPLAAIYALGLAAGWVYRGFRRQ